MTEETTNSGLTAADFAIKNSISKSGYLLVGISGLDERTGNNLMHLWNSLRELRMIDTLDVHIDGDIGDDSMAFRISPEHMKVLVQSMFDSGMFANEGEFQEVLAQIDEFLPKKVAKNQELRAEHFCINPPIHPGGKISVSLDRLAPELQSTLRSLFNNQSLFFSLDYGTEVENFLNTLRTASLFTDEAEYQKVAEQMTDPNMLKAADFHIISLDGKNLSIDLPDITATASDRFKTFLEERLPSAKVSESKGFLSVEANKQSLATAMSWAADEGLISRSDAQAVAGKLRTGMTEARAKTLGQGDPNQYVGAPGGTGRG